MAPSETTCWIIIRRLSGNFFLLIFTRKNFLFGRKIQLVHSVVHARLFSGFSGRIPHSFFLRSVFLPAAKPTGHRMESVVLLVLLVVVVAGVTTFSDSPYWSTLKNVCVGNSEQSYQIFESLIVIWQHCSLFPTHTFLVYLGEKNHIHNQSNNFDNINAAGQGTYPVLVCFLPLLSLFLASDRYFDRKSILRLNPSGRTRENWNGIYSEGPKKKKRNIFWKSECSIPRPVHRSVPSPLPPPLFTDSPFKGDRGACARVIKEGGEERRQKGNRKISHPNMVKRAKRRMSEKKWKRVRSGVHFWW